MREKGRKSNIRPGVRRDWLQKVSRTKKKFYVRYSIKRSSTFTKLLTPPGKKKGPCGTG